MELTQLQIRQRNQIARNLEGEWMDFLRQRIKIAQSVYHNFEKPTDPKEQKEDKILSKKLVKLVQLYTKISQVEASKMEQNAIRDINLYYHQKSVKSKWSELNEKQISLLNEYVRLKKQFIKQYPLQL